MKTKQDNNVTDHIGVVYAENETELSWPIGPDAVCEENQIGQWHNWLYRYGLHWKWNWVVVTDLTK